MSHTTLRLLTVLWILPVVAGADELTVSTDRDNTLYESPTGNLSNGAGEHFFAGLNAQGAIRRAVIHFDLSAIPAGSIIESAELTLNMSMTIAGAVPVALHGLTADWGEGTSDAPGGEGGGTGATDGDATWLHTFWDTDLWSSPGGDFAPTASATAVVGGAGFYTWGSTAGMVADVQAWVDDPAQNFGWLVLGEESPGGKDTPTAKRFDSREIGVEGTLAPRLVVQYTPPVPVELRSFEIGGD